MARLLFKIRPLTDFGSRMTGGMLFGQIAWQLREAFGEERLRECLKGYCENQPFLVVSDAMPSGFVPLPTLPLSMWATAGNAADRKYLKAKKWLPRKTLDEPLSTWPEAVLSNAELPQQRHAAGALRTRNSISRATGTTGTDAFAPYSVFTESFAKDALLDVIVVCDEARLSREELRMVIESIGLLGFGRDASTGLGKFEVADLQEMPDARPSKHWLALSALRAGGVQFDPENCFYRPVTYFGRHGNERAVGPTPFKKPIVLADAAAFLTTAECLPLLYAGCGITGHSAYSDTVHQGYAPLLPVLGFAA